MSHRRDPDSTAFSSNVVRLSIREWCAVLGLFAVAVAVIGGVWRSVYKFEPSPDYRIPYELSEDYWLFDRYCGLTDGEGRTLVFGDSFIWGQYVDRDQTLTQALNRRVASERFVNAGLDGAHPLALRGLIQFHCSGLKDDDVILHLNLLWLSTPQADLQTERDADFNHPRLVPQFAAEIPSYREPLSDRIGIVIGRHLPLSDWVRHLHILHFDGADLGRWTLENPYRNPFRQITLDPAAYDSDSHPDGQAWTSRGQNQRDLPWVELSTSLQWQAFRDLVEMLRGRGNRVLVLIGPLNEHMLRPASLQANRGILEGVERWLREGGVTYLTLPTLPSDLYVDLSHPLAEGYTLLAEAFWEWWGGERFPG